MTRCPHLPTVASVQTTKILELFPDHFLKRLINMGSSGIGSGNKNIHKDLRQFMSLLSSLYLGCICTSNLYLTWPWSLYTESLEVGHFYTYFHQHCRMFSRITYGKLVLQTCIARPRCYVAKFPRSSPTFSDHLCSNRPLYNFPAQPKGSRWWWSLAPRKV